MKYFLDTEFLEGKQIYSQSLFKFNFWLGKEDTIKPTIDLISIGIISEDGREYYAISKDFNLKEAWNRYDITEKTTQFLHKREKGKIDLYRKYWIRENVLKPIHYELATIELKNKVSYPWPLYDDWCKLIESKDGYSDRHFKTFKKILEKHGKSNEQIAQEIKDFVSLKDHPLTLTDTLTATREYKYDFDRRMDYVKSILGQVEFYGYYCDYDWVAFCWLFGKMIDLPTGFPMYCKDLKQIMDDMLWTRIIVGDTYEQKLKAMKGMATYPKQSNEHNALADAKWNLELYKFLDWL